MHGFIATRPPPPGERPELPIERVNRIARDLSAALDELNDDVGGEGAIWTMSCRPSKLRPVAILESVDWPPQSHAPTHMESLIATHRGTRAAWDRQMAQWSDDDAQEPTEAEEAAMDAACQADREAWLALLNYRAEVAGEDALRARYLLHLLRATDDRLERDEVDMLLNAMAS